MIQLAPAEEERAHQLARESLIFVCHDHNLAPEDMEENTGYPPYTYAEGVEDISRVPNIIRGLIALGLSDHDIRQIMGGNLLRLFRQVRECARSGPWEYVPYATGPGACTDGVTPL